MVVAGLVLLIGRWRGWGKYAALAWGVGVVNLVVPIAAHELDYRYALSAVPFACLALGLVCIRKPAPGPPRRWPTSPRRPPRLPRRDAGGLAADAADPDARGGSPAPGPPVGFRHG